MVDSSWPKPVAGPFLRSSLRGTKQPLQRTVKKLNANGDLTAAYRYDEIRGASKFCFFLELHVHPAQLPRRLLLFVLIQKVTKKIKSAERLLCAQASHAQSRKNCGLESFCFETLSVADPAMQKFPMPCPTHRPAVFSAFSRSLSADGKPQRHA